MGWYFEDRETTVYSACLFCKANLGFNEVIEHFPVACSSTSAAGFTGSFPSTLASWFGLTPRERSNGTKRRLGRISKQGDVYLRMLLIHGARSALLAPSSGSEPSSRSATCRCGRSSVRQSCTGTRQRWRGRQQAGASDLVLVVASFSTDRVVRNLT